MSAPSLSSFSSFIYLFIAFAQENLTDFFLFSLYKKIKERNGERKMSAPELSLII